MITSVYFDNQNLDVYHTRLERLQGATLVRVRWYGENPDLSGVHGETTTATTNHGLCSDDGDDINDHDDDGRRRFEGGADVFVERKTHHESWSLDGSVKERFRLDRSQLAEYITSGGVPKNIAEMLRGTGTEEDDKAARLAEEVATLELRDRRLGPSLRTEYRRVAFQLSTSNAVRVSLDTELRFTCETRARRHAGTSSGGGGGGGGEMGTYAHQYEFPYAILEVKLQEQAPRWIEEVLERVPVIEVHKFSKFLHGTQLTRRGGGGGSVGGCTGYTMGKHSGGGGGGESGLVRRLPHWCTEDVCAELERVDRRRDVLRRALVDIHAATTSSIQNYNVRNVVTPTSTPLLTSTGTVAQAVTEEDHVVVDVQVHVHEQSAAHVHEGPRADSSGSVCNGCASGENDDALPRTASAPVFVQGGRGISSDLSGGRDAVDDVLRPPSRRGRGLMSSPWFNHSDARRGAAAARTYLSSLSLLPSSSSSSSPHRRRYVPVKIEPKTFFANERTLLQWLSMSVLILFMSLALLSLEGARRNDPDVVFAATSSRSSVLSSDDPSTAATTTSSSSSSINRDSILDAEVNSRGGVGGTGYATGILSGGSGGSGGGTVMTGPFDVTPLVRYNRFASAVCGAILAPVAVIFMIYALITYLWRSRRIARREPSARYDDVWGPFALVTMLVVISTAAVILAISAHDWRGGV